MFNLTAAAAIDSAPLRMTGAYIELMHGLMAQSRVRWIDHVGNIVSGTLRGTFRYGFDGLAIPTTSPIEDSFTRVTMDNGFDRLVPYIELWEGLVEGTVDIED